MSKSNEELHEQISDMLLLFVDFIYALVFWQIIAEVYDKIIDVPALSFHEWNEKIKNFVAVFEVFYFLAWDWIGGRILTVKNPYRGFTRFFFEIAIAFCAYGLVLNVIKQDTLFLCCIVLILLLGGRWASRTLEQYPGSNDRFELKVIGISHYTGALLASLTFILVRFYFHFGFSWLSVILFGVVGWIFIFIHDVFSPRASGILGGPQMAFLSRRRAKRMRDRVIRPSSRKKGVSDGQ